uniref:Cms1 ribosomal small subunit homolog n=1 Tax=Homo sapiens TaxID=9606 RepID=F8WC72_HUMAN
MADDLGDEWWENQPTGAGSSPGPLPVSSRVCASKYLKT